jgi:LysR family transcriptional activator of nhaA
MDPLNYHHLRYFCEVARDGNLTRTARRLRVSASAVSSQIRQLEEQLGEALFAREGRGLVLTEAGQLAHAHAEAVFAAGADLVATFREGHLRAQVLRVGAVATLSRNFQRSFLRPLLGQDAVRLQLTSGSFEELLARLSAHEVDVVLANRPGPSEGPVPYRSLRLARQPVSVVASQPRPAFRFSRDVSRLPWILPGPSTDLRADFEQRCARLGVRPRVVAEVDDMAMMRLLVRDSEALALVPSVVVRDELAQGVLHELARLPDIVERFHAITVARRFQHPLLDALLARGEADLLAPPESAPRSADR